MGKMSRPGAAGIIFEIGNAEGKSLFTPCVMPLPPMPFDWKSAPVRFRAVAEPPAQHSAPLPTAKAKATDGRGNPSKKNRLRRTRQLPTSVSCASAPGSLMQ